ncbi:nitroreductase family protein [Haploplasma axanthum]|uniref:Nitroreductase A n=1 Tax=Haploplasma axanthum TaxID=29552 RepID=A0A449BDF0_HAPAX|nr:nitroreductase family protein [Haploplasma axanthum]VEU80447.1 nitroreductase A [Haploplasma axanthum]
MEFNDVIDRRHTVRSFKDIDVSMEQIKRIIDAGIKAPSNNHLREIEFIVIKDKERIKEVIKKIPKTQSPKRVEFIMNSWKLKDEVQIKMYQDSIPKQYSMLCDANVLLIPLFKNKKNILEPKSLSDLNGFASMWCSIENIFLATTNENLGYALRIPFKNEIEYLNEVLEIPKDYVIPCYIAIGHKDDNENIEQVKVNFEDKIHFDRW